MLRNVKTYFYISITTRIYLCYVSLQLLNHTLRSKYNLQDFPDISTACFKVAKYDTKYWHLNFVKLLHLNIIKLLHLNIYRILQLNLMKLLHLNIFKFC